jgi:hypothetical protein
MCPVSISRSRSLEFGKKVGTVKRQKEKKVE